MTFSSPWILSAHTYVLGFYTVRSLAIHRYRCANSKFSPSSHLKKQNYRSSYRCAYNIQCYFPLFVPFVASALKSRQTNGKRTFSIFPGKHQTSIHHKESNSISAGVVIRKLLHFKGKRTVVVYAELRQRWKFCPSTDSELAREPLSSYILAGHIKRYNFWWHRRKTWKLCVA